MEGQKIEIDVCNSLAAMAYVVADQQRMFKEKDLKIQELEKKCQNFAGTIVSLESQCKMLDDKVSKAQDECMRLNKSLHESEERAAELSDMVAQIPTWKSIERDPEGNFKFDPEKKGKYVLMGKLNEDVVIYDMFNIPRREGEYVYFGYETGKPLPDLSSLIKVMAKFVGGIL